MKRRTLFVLIAIVGTAGVLSADITLRGHSYRSPAGITSGETQHRRTVTAPTVQPIRSDGISPVRAAGDPDADPSQPYIVIDTHTNRLYLRTRDSVLLSARCSTGTGAELTDSITGQSWTFDTPKGFFRATSRSVKPWWRKPDWAFIEAGKRPPSKESDRLDPEALGDYAIGFGDGYYIHGTLYQRLLGVAATHGCVRLGRDDLRLVYNSTAIGTPIVIF